MLLTLNEEKHRISTYILGSEVHALSQFFAQDKLPVRNSASGLKTAFGIHCCRKIIFTLLNPKLCSNVEQNVSQ